MAGPGLDPTHGVLYTYAANSMAKSQIDYLSSAGATLAKTTFGYEYQAPTSVNRDLITGVRNEIVGQQDASLYSYTNDSLRRRTSVVYRGAAFTADNLVLYDDPATQDTFDGYNDRGELQHARRHAGDDPDVPGSPLTPNHYAYDYDDIGNRQTNAVDAAQAFYCIENNKLNQYEGVEASPLGVRGYVRELHSGVETRAGAETRLTAEWQCEIGDDMRFDWSQYASLCEAFLQGHLAPQEFRDSYLTLWRRDRDAEYAQRETWPERYDVVLQRQFAAGEITSDEFSRQWYALWGIAPEDAALRNLADQIMTTVGEYEPDPELRAGTTFLNEDDLRREIQQIMDEAEGTTSQ